MLYGVSFKYEERSYIADVYVDVNNFAYINRTISEENPKLLKSFARLVPQIVRYVGNHRMFHVKRNVFDEDFRAFFSNSYQTI